MKESYWDRPKPKHPPVPFVEGRKDLAPFAPLPERKEVAPFR